MVEYSLTLDLVFQSLADSTRRDILRQVAKKAQTIGELAGRYELTFAGIAKHISILEHSHLVKKRRQGREQMVSLTPRTFEITRKHLEQYEKMWNDRFEALDEVLQSKL